MASVEKIKNVCDFFVITHKLQNTLRAGWVTCGVPAERIQSVAEHIYSAQMLALVINSEFELGLNISKIALMLAIHELGECIIGDLPAYGCPCTREEKRRMEDEAVEKILSGLSSPQEIKKLYKEYEERKTGEARFCYLIDKLECCFQAKYHEDMGHLEWEKLKPNEAQKERIAKRRDQGYKRFSDFWIDADIERHFMDDEIFKTIAEFVLKNDGVFKDN